MGELAVPVERGAGGRPSSYSPELADAICQHIITGLSVRKISEREDMPCEDTIYTWLAKYPEFSEKYTLACQHRTNRYREECMDLSDMIPDGFISLRAMARCTPAMK